MVRISFITTAIASSLSFSLQARATTGDVVQSFPSSFESPDGLMWDGTALWATDCSTTRIDKVDPQTGEVIGSIDVRGVNSDELAWDGQNMWMSDHTASEMPGADAPPPRLYRVDPQTGAVLSYLAAPGMSKYPMGVAWDGQRVWNVDLRDRRIFELEPTTGAVIGSIPAPAAAACGMTWDGACLWVTDVGINGRVYHLDPLNGEVLSSFDGPGGSGHQTTGVAWDGTNLWVHDEASGRARIFKVAVDDITEGGRCKQPDLGNLEVPDAGDAGGPTAELDPVVGSTASGCSLVGRRTGTSANPLRGIVAIPLVAAFLLRRRRRCIWR